jgi:thiamine biosynthesis lipoprotein
MLPAGVGLDLGGIGKGLAADLIVDRTLAAGADGISVNLGGDLRAEGDAPTDDGWVVGIEQPFRPGDELARVRLAGGAVVTTSPLHRRWRHGGSEVHHLIDPSTGWPAVSNLASVTIVGGEAAGAEIAAKAVFLAGVEEGLWFVEKAGLAALLVDVAGCVHMTPSIEAYLA